MKPIHTFLAVFVLALSGACTFTNPEEQAENSLKDELYLVHDEVMPKIADVVRLERQLNEFIEQDSSLRPAISPALDLLVKADEGMMAWMSGFKQPSELKASKSHQEIIEYLNLEKSKIEQVRTDILSGLEKGRTLLDSLQTLQGSKTN